MVSPDLLPGARVPRSLDTVDFALDPMPGHELHEVLRAYRERAPVMPTRFLGLPAFVVTGYAALVDAFHDVKAFPPHRMYQGSFEPAIGKSFISMEDEEQHRIYRKENLKLPMHGRPTFNRLCGPSLGVSEGQRLSGAVVVSEHLGGASRGQF